MGLQYPNASQEGDRYWTTLSSDNIFFWQIDSHWLGHTSSLEFGPTFYPIIAIIINKWGFHLIDDKRSRSLTNRLPRTKHFYEGQQVGNFWVDLGGGGHPGASFYCYGGWHAVWVDYISLHVGTIHDVSHCISSLSPKSGLTNEPNEYRQ